MSDPFASLRHLLDGAAPAGSGEPADLFAGSEPAPAAPAPVVEPTSPAAPAAADPASVSLDQLASMIVELDARLAAIEQLARRNGWPL